MKRLLILFFALAIAFPFSAQTKKQTTRKKAKTTRVTKKRSTAKKKNTAKYSNSSIKGLRNQRAGVQRKIKQQERLLRANKADVKKRLGDLMVLNTEIDRHKKSIDTIQSEIAHLDGNISMLQSQLAMPLPRRQAHRARQADVHFQREELRADVPPTAFRP